MDSLPPAVRAAHSQFLKRADDDGRARVAADAHRVRRAADVHRRLACRAAIALGGPSAAAKHRAADADAEAAARPAAP